MNVTERLKKLETKAGMNAPDEVTVIIRRFVAPNRMDPGIPPIIRHKCPDGRWMTVSEEYLPPECP